MYFAAGFIFYRDYAFTLLQKQKITNEWLRVCGMLFIIHLTICHSLAHMLLLINYYSLLTTYHSFILEEVLLYIILDDDKCTDNNCTDHRGGRWKYCSDSGATTTSLSNKCKEALHPSPQRKSLFPQRV